MYFKASDAWLALGICMHATLQLLHTDGTPDVLRSEAGERQGTPCGHLQSALARTRQRQPLGWQRGCLRLLECVVCFA